MIKNKKLIITILGFLLCNANSFASQSAEILETKVLDKKTIDNNANQLQQIINDFQSFIAKIPVEIREEVKKYRIEIAKINNQKRALYKRISQEAQHYLAKEQEYKKKLALAKKHSIVNQENMNSSQDHSSKIENQSK